MSPFAVFSSFGGSFVCSVIKLKLSKRIDRAKTSIAKDKIIRRKLFI
jgi:hypothetical protein